MKKIVVFSLFGYQCTPWSVPTISRWGGSFYSKKSRPEVGILNLPDWQAAVKKAAVEAMASCGAPLQVGPIKLHIDFYGVTPPGHRHGELWTIGIRWNPDARKGKGAWVKVGKSQPDILNLFKGTEDALESVTYGNDVQSCIISSSRWYGPIPGVKVTVFAIEPGDFTGTGDPAPIEAKDVKKSRPRKKAKGQ